MRCFAVGLALIFGVANLINFAHGSVYTIGAYIGWAAITFLHTPLPLTMLIVFVGAGLVGVAIERIGLRPLQGIGADRAVDRHHRPQLRARSTRAADLLAEPAGAAERPAGLAHRHRRRLDRRDGSADRRHRRFERRRALRLSAFHQAWLRRQGDGAGPRRGAANGRQRRRRQQRRVRHRPRRSAASAACWSACITTTSTPR